MQSGNKHILFKDVHVSSWLHNRIKTHILKIAGLAYLTLQRVHRGAAVHEYAKALIYCKQVIYSMSILFVLTVHM